MLSKKKKKKKNSIKKTPDAVPTQSNLV